MSVPDDYPHVSSIVAPADNALNVEFGSPADDVELVKVSRAIRCGGGGGLDVTMKDGSTVSFVVAAGDVLPIRVTHVLASSTATNIVALW
ncbi:MAG: hypothetical protein AB7R90_10480 [Reyranellaceae bacterium]